MLHEVRSQCTRLSQLKGLEESVISVVSPFPPLVEPEEEDLDRPSLSLPEQLRHVVTLEEMSSLVHVVFL